MHLTDLTIRKLKNPDVGKKTYFDDAIGGFCIRVSQGGAKTFIVLLGKQRKRKSIGRYPEISLSDARREAKRLQADVQNIIATKNGLPKISFDDAKGRFMLDVRTRTRSSTHLEYERLLNKHFPLDKDLLDVTKRDIKISLEKINKAPSTKQHAFVAIRTMMNWCVRHELIDVSPLPPMTFKTNSRSRILTDEELKIVWNRAVEVGYPFGTIVQLLILTGQRRGEIAALWQSLVFQFT